MKHSDTRNLDSVRDSADPVIRIQVAEDSAPDQIVIPDAQLLVSAKFKKIGSDLTLTGADGKTVVVEGYFDLLKRPELVAPGGGGLSADVVERLAVSQTAGQYAQVGAPAGAIAIGRVERLGGSATVQHANGTVSDLQIGDVVYQGDVVETRDSSQLGISFTDGTAFNLGTNARMVLSELIYSAGGQSNSGVFNLVKGTMTFVAGQVAKSGDMRVVTPVSTMGIRGTSGQLTASTDAFGITISVVYSLMADPDGSIGFFDILDNAGNVIGTMRTTDSAVIVTPAANLTLLAQTLQKTPEMIQAELAVAQVLFPIFLSNPANFIQTPQLQDLQPKGGAPIGSPAALTLPPQGLGDPGPTVTIQEKVSGTISPSPPPGSPPGTPVQDIIIPEQKIKVEIPANLLPLINIDSSNHLIEAAGANPGVATSSAPVIKSDLNADDIVSYDAAALTADKWDNLGNGIFGKLGSYGAAALNTTGVAAAALLAAGWIDVGAGIYEKLVVLHDASGNAFNETVRVNAAVNTLTYALDNTKADPLAGGTVVTEQFVVHVTDNHGGQNHNVATFTVEGTNDAATLSADVRLLTEGDAAADISTSGKLTISDTDSAQTFQAQTDTAGLYGKFSIDASGAWTYTADGAHNEFAAGITYTETFQVHSADGSATSVTINIAGSNEAPVAHNDAYSIQFGQTLHVPTPGLLGNDTDVDSSALTALIDSGAVGGYLKLNPDGSFDFTPTAVGTASFTYKASDGVASSNAATVTINVSAGSDTLDRSASTTNEILVATGTIENLIGGAGNDVIIGDNNNNVLSGGAGNDVLFGGIGNDVMIGGAGDDSFAFRNPVGHDVVVDFNVGDAVHHDTLDLRTAGFTSVMDVLNHATDVGTDLVIHVGSDDITLLSVTKAMLAANTSVIQLF